MRTFREAAGLGVWRRGWRGWWAVWFTLGCAAFGWNLMAEDVPRITSIERRGRDVVVRAAVPVGVARVVLESCAHDSWRGWRPRAVVRLDAGGTEASFTVAVAPGQEMFRVRADASDPLPAAFYGGGTNFPGEWVAEGSLSDPWLRGGDVAAPTANEGAGSGREVVESDIWVVEGNWLYFFNQYRGLQRIDVSDPDRPRVDGTFSLPGAGEQMYLHRGTRAVLLAHDPCGQWGIEAESAVVVVDVESQPLREVARLPIPGRLVESRLVGDALYVATETWQPRDDGSGAWESGTWVSGFDLSLPDAPVAREPKWFPGSGNVVTATDRFLFVAVTDYSRTWPWSSSLQVVDIHSPDGSLNPYATISLAGRVADKFKIDLAEDVLRVVVEAMDSPSGGRWVTVLETIRLADPVSAPPQPYTRLDRLELARGERLFGTRFDGNRAYVVTFLRIDPLWIVDLSDPSDLKVAGELEIPGWSTYLRPMGDRLLTLGVDDSRGWRVAVQLFDVGDPARPALLAKVPLGEDSSWSEATQDEKAFGVFPEAGLLLVPVSEWTGSESRQGVQLIDFDRDHLTRRGLLSSPTVVPRRATWLRDRVLAISGRELVTADVQDRDRPVVVGSAELAYPVERVVLADGYRLEITAGSLRVFSVGVEGTGDGERIDLGDLPVWGAAYRDARLHLVQGRAAEVTWSFDERANEWIGRTNAGRMVATVWDASALPRLTKVGEDTAETAATWIGDMKPFWPGEGLLVWGTTEAGWNGWWRGGPMPWVDTVARAADVMPGFWYPWWSSGPRRLLTVSTGQAGIPEIVSDLELDGKGDPSGEVAAAGTLIYASRRVVESEVIATNQIIERVWFPTEPQSHTNILVRPDGSTETNVVRVAEGSGDWRVVTNEYPVLRYWARYLLDVVDYGADPRNPVRRPEVAIPGSLRGLSHGGAVVYTFGDRSETPAQSSTTWLEAGAYDGVEVRLIDSVALANQGQGETAVAAIADGLAYVARGGWQTNAVQRLEVWRLGDDGRWNRGAVVDLSANPSELATFHDLLLARNGGVLDLFDRSTPAEPRSVPVRSVPGCYGGSLTRGDGNLNAGMWLPLGDFGAIRVGP